MSEARFPFWLDSCSVAYPKPGNEHRRNMGHEADEVSLSKVINFKPPAAREGTALPTNATTPSPNK